MIRFLGGCPDRSAPSEAFTVNGYVGVERATVEAMRNRVKIGVSEAVAQMSYNMLRRFASLVLVAPMMGCAMGGLMQVSAPSLDAADETELSGGILRLEGFTASVKPENPKDIVMTLGPIILPVIPIYLPNRVTRERLPFLISIQFEPTTEGVSFDPRKIALRIGGRTYQPIAASNFVTNADISRQDRAFIPGHKWNCYQSSAAPQRDRKVTRALPNDGPLALDITRRGCVIVEFPLDTPAPDTEFDLELGGIHRSGQAIRPRVVRFRPETKILWLPIFGT
jgi:hypothetical protein